MLKSLTSAISGLQNFQERMDVIGNNIANVNTTGFKMARVDFADSFSQTLRGSSAGTEAISGTSAMQVGSGVTTGAVRNIYTQGAVTGTGVKTDLAIAGEGYFTVRDTLSDTSYATRAGDFHLDDHGYLVTNKGMRVQGYNDTTLQAAGDLKIDLRGMLGEATPPTDSSNFGLDDFLNIESFATRLAAVPAAGTPEEFLVSKLSSDTASLLGAWNTAYTADPTVMPGTDLQSALVSDLNSVIHGSLIYADGPGSPPAPNPFAGVTLRPEVSELLAGDTSALDGEILFRLNRMILEDTYSTDLVTNTLPTMQSYAIDGEGKININLTDGSQYVRGQVLLQNFRDPTALMKEGDSLYSGLGLAGPLTQPAAPGSVGVGKIQAGALELSNVDLANEFSSMITAQRAFQATARIISTSDEMLQELVNLKR
jgi:flagellar hook protein FlgE